MLGTCGLANTQYAILGTGMNVVVVLNWLDWFSLGSCVLGDGGRGTWMNGVVVVEINKADVDD